MAGFPGDRHADRAAAPALSLRRLAAAPPSFDQALDDLIVRAHQTELAVGDDDVIADEPATAAPGESPDDASSDSLTDPFATDPYIDLARSDAAIDATTDPYGDPTHSERRDDGEEQAEAYQLALRGQLAGLQRRVAVAEAHEPALREQLVDLQRRLAAAEARQADARSLRRRSGVAVALAFAAGLAVMFAVSRLGDRSASRPRTDPAAMDALGAGATRSTEPIVTPIDPAPIADPSTNGSGAATSKRGGSAAAASQKPGPGAVSTRPATTPSTGSRPASDSASVRSPSSGSLVDPFAESPAGATRGATGTGSATDSPTTPPPAEAAPRDAGAIVNPFDNR
jgi:hypothetical protein